MTIYAHHGAKHFQLTVNPQWARRHDNGALVSCGLTVGEDLPERELNRLIKTGKAIEVAPEVAAHSACLSRCKLRGDAICQW